MIIHESLKRALDEDGQVVVPRALLACCLDVLTECDKQVGVTGSNFDDDMALCIGNLKAILG